MHFSIGESDDNSAILIGYTVMVPAVPPSFAVEELIPYPSPEPPDLSLFRRAN